MTIPMIREQTNQTPWEFAHVHLVTGEQRSGKNTVAVARVRDAYDRDCVRIYLKEEKGIEAIVPSVYDSGKIFSRPTILAYDRHSRFAKMRYNGEVKVFKIADDYKLYSPMKTFTTFHLFGIPSKYCTWTDVIDFLNKDIIRDCYLILDQFEIVGSAREGMSLVAKYFYKKAYQFGKRHIEVYVLVPEARLGDWTMRLMATERIRCERESGTNLITITIRRRGLRGAVKYTFDGSEYWRNFWTDEEIATPDYQVKQVLELMKATP